MSEHLVLFFLVNQNHFVFAKLIIPLVQSYLILFLSYFPKILSPRWMKVHGDAALSGQGVMQETLALSNVPHFDIGGALHISINNQVCVSLLSSWNDDS